MRKFFLFASILVGVALMGSADATLAAVPTAGPLAPTPPAPDLNDQARWDRVIDAAEQFGEKEVIRSEKFVRQFRAGHFPAGKYQAGGEMSGGNDENNVSANFDFAHVNMLRALLHTNPPTYEVDPRDAAQASGGVFSLLTQINPQNLLAPPLFKDPDDARRQFADSLELVAQHSFEICGTRLENDAALFDAITRGLGVTKQSFDPQRGLDRADCIKRHELYIDPHARHTIRQAQYVVHTITLPIEEARAFFASKGVTENIEPNYTLADGKGLNQELAAQDRNAEEKDLYRFYEIWSKKAEARVLCYYAWSTKAKLAEMPWPFQLEADDFPFALLRFNTQFVRVQDAFSELDVVDGLSKTIEEMVRFHKSSISRGIAKKLLFDPKSIDETTLAQIKNPKDFQAVALKNMGGRSLDQVIKVLELNGTSDPAMELYSELKGIKDEITGMDEMIRGAEQRDLTATHAEIVDQMQQLRTGLKSRAFDEFQCTQLRQRVQIARQLMDPEKVRAIAGDNAYWLWLLHAKDADDFLNEYSVGVAAGSSGQLAKKERMQRMARFLAMAKDENASAMQMMQPPIWDTTAIADEMVREDNVRNPDRFKFPPAPPMLPPGMGLPPGAGPMAPPPAGPNGPVGRVGPGPNIGGAPALPMTAGMLP